MPVGWRECTLTRATELEALATWIAATCATRNDWPLFAAIERHLAAAREAASGARFQPRRRFRILRNGPLLERARSNLDAAEAELLNLAPPWYLLGQVPCLVTHVKCHLVPTDTRRLELERIARRLGVADAAQPEAAAADLPLADQYAIVKEERGKIITAMRAACSAALREQIRLHNFRNSVLAAAAVLWALAAVLAITGWRAPTVLPLCFAPEEAGQATVVCPTAQSTHFPSTVPTAAAEDIDDYVKSTVHPYDLLVIELVGLVAAAVAAAAAVRNIRGSSERHGVPMALAALKLPTGAVTAFLGLLLMRGQFVPGLTALDTSAQILAWALIFGYAQQLFTRLVDRQGQAVLESVRGADKGRAALVPQ